MMRRNHRIAQATVWKDEPKWSYKPSALDEAVARKEARKRRVPVEEEAEESDTLPDSPLVAPCRTKRAKTARSSEQGNIYPPQTPHLSIIGSTSSSVAEATAKVKAARKGKGRTSGKRLRKAPRAQPEPEPQPEPQPEPEQPRPKRSTRSAKSVGTASKSLLINTLDIYHYG